MTSYISDQVATSDTKVVIQDEPKSQVEPAMDRLRSLASNLCSLRTVKKKLPIFDWLPKYNVETGVADLIAGITVGLTVIPQGIAYALVAGLPPQYGLYSAFMGCFMYVLFGSCKDITVGPTAIMSLLTAEYASKGPAFVILLTFLTGLIILLLGILRLGFVIDFISVPVTAGFTSAAAIVIASGQVKSIFGLEIKHSSHSEGVAGTWMDVIENFDTARLSDSILGITCIIVLLAMRTLKSVTWLEANPEDPSCCQTCCLHIRRNNETVRKILAKVIWVISTARNAIIVIACTVMAYGFDPVLPDDDADKRNTTFILTGNIKAGLPDFQPPPFSFNDTSSGTHYDFPAMVTELGAAIIILPLLAILENVAIAKAFCKLKTRLNNQS